VCGRLGLTLSKIVLCKSTLSQLARVYFPNVSILAMEEEEALRVPEDELDGVWVVCLERVLLDMKLLLGLCLV
jgi:hypothetical protein